MINIVAILLTGRLLNLYGFVAVGDIIACSILTMWASRVVTFYLMNAMQTKENLNKSNTTKNLKKKTLLISEGEKEAYNEILNVLESNDIAYFPQEKIKNTDYLELCLQRQDKKVCTVNNDGSLFYGTIIDNITFFDESKYDEAYNLLSEFKLEHLVNNLPFNFNYVITGQNDYLITYDLVVAINLFRALVYKPDIIILNIDVNRINHTFMRDISTYCKVNKIKLVSKNSRLSVRKLFATVYDAEDKQLCK